MKKSVLNRLVFIALVAVGTVFVSGERAGYAQKLVYERAQYEVDVPPPVDLPSAANEADMFPSTGDVVPPSLQDQVYDDGVATDYGVDANFADDVAIEPSPVDGVFNDVRLTDTGVDYDAYGQTDDGPAPIFSTGTWWWRGRWYTQMDVMVLDRDDHRRIILIGGATRTEDIARHHAAPGARFTLGRFLGRDAASRDHMVEFAYMGLFDWSDGREIFDRNGPGNGSLTIGLQVDAASEIITPFINSDVQGFFYDSDLDDWQLNYRLQTRPGKDVLALQPNGMWVRHAVSSHVRNLVAGLRFSSINEQADYTARQQGVVSRSDVIDGLDGTMRQENIVTDDGAINGRYLVQTHNDLFGLHIGGEMIEKRDSWSWGVKGRVGSLVNLMNRRSTIRSNVLDEVLGAPQEVRRLDDNGVPLFIEDDGAGNLTATTSPVNSMTGAANDPLIDTVTEVTFETRTLFESETVSDERLSFLIDVGVFGKYQLRPNLAFRAGYDAMLFTSIVLAPENLGLANGFKQLNVNGTAVYHGGYAGFETTW